MTEKKRFVKYDGNTIVDLKLVKSWIISNGNVELLLEILNNEKTSKKEIIRKRCTDCKYTKGIGIDFWCGEGHTEYEVFIGETNCPYFEYHDWSKGTPSETEKRFAMDNENDIKQRKELRLQMLRLYNYFENYFEDVMSPNAFSEMWDNVKEDEKWEKK